MGVYYWLNNQQKKALKWWVKSISVARTMGAKPELARTNMEVGKRLSESKSKNVSLNGTSAIEYLDMAETSFKEMDLQWDLEQLGKIRKT